jgi:protein TonB
MLPQQIATADYLDILFEEKNKLYGAYPLRKEYARRLYFSLFIASAITVSSICSFYLLRKPHQVSGKAAVNGPIVILEDFKKEFKKSIIPPPPPPPPAKKIATSMFTTLPKIVKNAAPDEMPPDVETLANTKIAAFTQAGENAPDIVAPPIGTDNGVTAAPARKEEDVAYIPVHMESSYPGGVEAWRRFLIKTLRYPAEAQENGIKGAVTVKFIVDTDGKVSDVEAISGPEELRAEAVRVIKLSGKWTPANQNGRMVRTYKQQAIVFQLNDE